MQWPKQPLTISWPTFTFLFSIAQSSRTPLKVQLWTMESLQTIWQNKHVTGFRRFFYLVTPNETTFDNLEEIPQYVDDVSWKDAINCKAWVEIKATFVFTVYLVDSRHKMDRSHSSIGLRFDLAASVSSILPVGAVPMKNNTPKNLRKGENHKSCRCQNSKTVDSLAAISKCGSLWNCEIHFAA